MDFVKITKMASKDARSFLLEESSYLNLDLPSYLSFKKCLLFAECILTTKSGNFNELANVSKTKISSMDDINYKMIVNKDSCYAWRPITLIHPIIYVDLVNTITQQDHWRILIDRFEMFEKESLIRCVSIPGKSLSKESNKAATIMNWWSMFEQEQIVQSLEYDYCVHTDIANCYPSIYTHSIAWAVMGKSEAKIGRGDMKNLGNILDRKIQDMQHGQTNGIPQGSILMDFFAELVLGYTDYVVSQVIIDEGLDKEIAIIRYRDDYRIFGNNKTLLKQLTIKLSEVLVDFNFTLNKLKTFESEDIINDSIKEDKRYWNRIFYSYAREVEVDKKTSHRTKFDYKSDISIQKQLLMIKEFSLKFANSSQISRALANLYDAKIYDLDYLPKNYVQLISITTDIMIRNPKSLKQSNAIIGKILDLIEDDEKQKDLMKKIIRKYLRRSHTDYSEVWLQSLDLAIGNESCYKSKLAKSIIQRNVEIWNTSWLNKDLNKWEQLTIVDESKLKKHSLVTNPKDVNLFKNY